MTFQCELSPQSSWNRTNCRPRVPRGGSGQLCLPNCLMSRLYLVHGCSWEEVNKTVANFKCKDDMVMKTICLFSHWDCAMALGGGQKREAGLSLLRVCVCKSRLERCTSFVCSLALLVSLCLGWPQEGKPVKGNILAQWRITHPQIGDTERWWVWCIWRSSAYELIWPFTSKLFLSDCASL